MHNYVLIDYGSGFVWGQAYADTPIDACRLVDEGCGVSGREYTMHRPKSAALHNGNSGYLVYVAPDKFRVNDGQDQSAIDAVSAMPCAATITYVA